MRWIAAVLAVSLAAPCASAGDKILSESWDLVHLGDGKAGFVHTIAKEIDRDGKKQIHTTVELRLTLRRNDSIIDMGMDTGTIETPDGIVTGTFMTQYLGKKQQTRIDGAVVGNQVKLTLNGNTPLNPAPWKADVLGQYKQLNLFKDRDLKAGDTFTFQTFEPTINLVIKMEVHVKGPREVLIPGTREKRKLLLVETVPEKIEHKPGEKIQLPIVMTWLDDAMEPVKTEVEVPGLGPLVMFRTTKAKALAPAPIGSFDLGYSQRVRLKNRIRDAHDTSAAKYRITIRNDDSAATTFSRDDRQQVKNVQGNTFELHVKGVPSSASGGSDDAPAAEFLQSSYFITSADPKVKELARKAVGAEADAWKKAQRIERWVHDHMRYTNYEAMATADHVARTLEGDCTEYAMLTAAMCRAEGVPSRTAIGLVYAEDKGAPFFAFHMWTEVWIKGRWNAIDATIGKGYVGAAHLKITDHSWHDERTMTPILPVVRVVGRVSIDVL
ncbi:MAG: transglutaminase domain-containing protein, partial [Planctomycetes bacterium]|nr:transglutaminase domain-containing protein [Planctomycetota bacterium]